MSSFRLYLGVLCWRWLWACLSRTWYVPDETWQSVEVAHRRVWDTGHLSWEWKHGVRSSLHPLMFQLPLQLLSAAGADSRQLVVLLPQLVQASVTAAGDVAMYRWVVAREGRSAGWWYLALLLTNWHSCYAGSRTLINTLETSLLCLGLPLFPGRWYLPVAAAAIMIRPTAAVTWLPLLLLHLHRLVEKKRLQRLLPLSLPPLLTVAAIVALDSIFYQHFTITPLNFFRVNILHNISHFYGTHPPWWYLTNTLFPTLGPILVPILSSLRSTPSIIALPCLTTLATLSLLPHKEMRFLQPLLPLLLYPAAVKMSQWTRGPPWRGVQVYISSLLGLCLLNLPLCLYLSLVHQRGVVDVISWASDTRHRHNSLLFLMPCHSTPLYSHLHQNIPTRFLTCEPNLSGQENYEDEADHFYTDPVPWLESHYPLDDSTLPTIIMFDSLLDNVKQFLDSRSYSQCSEFFHSHVREGRVGKNVLAFCQDGNLFL